MPSTPLLTPERKRALDALDAAEIKFLQSCGWERGAHGWVHRSLSRGAAMTQRDAVHETRKRMVREAISSRLG